MKKRRVAVLGATGTVGQRFVQLLEAHPWFQIAALVASDRSVGQPYGRACTWRLPTPMPEDAACMVVGKYEDLTAADFDLVFSALPAEAARDVEADLAHAGLAISSNASAFRREPDVPLLIPEVNPDHTSLIAIQRAQRWDGFIITNPNCTTTAIALVLKPLADAFGLKTVVAASLQAISGAGYPGVASLDVTDNVLPFIRGEEEKIEHEARLLLGRIADGRKVPAEFAVSAHANRVPVVDGHTVCLSLGFEIRPTPQEAASVLTGFGGGEAAGLPSAPSAPLRLHLDEDRPQPRLDRDAGGGMSVTVGRIRSCPVLDLRLVLTSHNTIRGAAGGSILNAELLVQQGFLR